MPDLSRLFDVYHRFAVPKDSFCMEGDLQHIVRYHVDCKFLRDEKVVVDENVQ